MNNIAPAEDWLERCCFSFEESEAHAWSGLTLFDAIPASIFGSIERLIGAFN
jgi:hypothetical protein